MKDKKIENALSNLNLQAPSLQTRERVLNAAQTAWRHSKNPSKSGMILRWTWYYAAAASLLIMLNMAFSGIDRHWTNLVYMEPVPYPATMEKEFIEKLVDSGIDPEIAVRLKTLVAVSNPTRNLEAQISRRQAVFLNYMSLTNGG